MIDYHYRFNNLAVLIAETWKESRRRTVGDRGGARGGARGGGERGQIETTKRKEEEQESSEKMRDGKEEL